MTLQAWNILLSATILGLLTGGGIWLRHVVGQQLKSKDTTIEALKSVVTLKDAHIASLQGNTAPEIAKAYSEMRKHAEQITADFNKVSETLAETTNRQKGFPADKALAEARGLMLASDILDKHLTRFFIDAEERRVLEPIEFICLVENAFLYAYAEISSVTKTRVSAASDVLARW